MQRFHNELFCSSIMFYLLSSLTCFFILSFTLKPQSPCVCHGKVAWKNICYTLPVYHAKNIAPVLIMSSLREKLYAFKHANEKIRLSKKPHCVQTHNPCKGSHLRVKKRKWRAALLQVVTRGLNVSVWAHAARLLWREL